MRSDEKTEEGDNVLDTVRKNSQGYQEETMVREDHNHFREG